MIVRVYHEPCVEQHLLKQRNRIRKRKKDRTKIVPIICIKLNGFLHWKQLLLTFFPFCNICFHSIVAREFVMVSFRSCSIRVCTAESIGYIILRHLFLTITSVLPFYQHECFFVFAFLYSEWKREWEAKAIVWCNILGILCLAALKNQFQKTVLCLEIAILYILLLLLLLALFQI